MNGIFVGPQWSTPLVTLIALCFAAAPAEFAIADDSKALNALNSSRSLKCEFTTGTATEWKYGEPITTKASKLTPMVFDSIDHEASSARLIGNAGASDLLLLATPESITFIEVTGSGNVNITSIFPNYAKGGRDFIAVHSRHVSLLSPLPSQYHGTCAIWQ